MPGGQTEPAVLEGRGGAGPPSLPQRRSPSAAATLSVRRELTQHRDALWVWLSALTQSIVLGDAWKFHKRAEFSEIDSLTKRSKVWCRGANFQKAFQIVKISLLVMAVKTCENSNSRHLQAAFFFVRNVLRMSVFSKPMKTKDVARMITPNHS